MNKATFDGMLEGALREALNDERRAGRIFDYEIEHGVSALIIHIQESPNSSRWEQHSFTVGCAEVPGASRWGAKSIK